MERDRLNESDRRNHLWVVVPEPQLDMEKDSEPDLAFVADEPNTACIEGATPSFDLKISSRISFKVSRFAKTLSRK
jgi:hypothetical protein